MTDHASFLQAIRADPDADAPRLIYADWLEEQGDTERAEFIRVQCKIADIRPGPEEARKAANILARYQKGAPVPLKAGTPAVLLARNAILFDKLRNRLKAELPEGVGVTLENPISTVHCRGFAICRRGFVAEVRCRLADWMGGPCCVCDMADFISDRPIERGCKACHGTGTFPGIGPALVAAHPVRKVVATDVRPWNAGNHRWGWTGSRSDFSNVPWFIPPAVFAVLPPSPDGMPRSHGRRWYPTEAAALEALSAALLRFAKESV